MNKREWMLQAALMWIRAGHGGPADDAAAALSGTYDAIVAASPEPADDGWLEWRGEKPYPEGRVDVKFRGGSVGILMDSDDLIWSHDVGGLTEREDIVAWRPARD